MLKHAKPRSSGPEALCGVFCGVDLIPDSASGRVKSVFGVQVRCHVRPSSFRRWLTHCVAILAGMVYEDAVPRYTGITSRCMRMASDGHEHARFFVKNTYLGLKSIANGASACKANQNVHDLELSTRRTNDLPCSSRPTNAKGGM